MFFEDINTVRFSKIKVHSALKNLNLEPNPDSATQPKVELIRKEHQKRSRRDFLRRRAK